MTLNLTAAKPHDPLDTVPRSLNLGLEGRSCLSRNAALQTAERCQTKYNLTSRQKNVDALIPSGDLRRYILEPSDHPSLGIRLSRWKIIFRVQRIHIGRLVEKSQVGKGAPNDLERLWIEASVR